MEAGDLAAMARMHGPHTVSYDPDSEVTRGDTAINAGYAKLFETYRAKVEFRNAQWVRSGAVLSSWGEFTLTLTPRAGGEPVRRSGRFTDVAVWTDKGWQYVVDHASVPAR
jgi:ketosteroid isomerase-like protein